jgi:predicted PurR-regulated permease PerM
MDVSDSKLYEKNVIEAAIKLTILGILVYGTLQIIQPFVMPVLWGIIIAVAMEPLIARVAKKMGGRKKTVSVLFALTVIGLLVVPTVMLIGSSIDEVQSLRTSLENETLVVPPPPAKVEAWPVIGPKVYKIWGLASSNLDAAIKQFAPQLKSAITNLLGKVGSGMKTVFMFIISVVIAAIMLSTADKGTATITRIVSRFAGEKGTEIVVLATATIRGVMQGVVGVAVIQAIMSAIGMVLVGVPAAGLWTMAVLVLAIIQLPPIIILAPIAAWVFTFADTVPAVIFLIWAIIVSASDGVLKPLLMGRGVDIPMLVILIGALGGMMLSGIIGLFVGAVVVAITYTLFMAWVEEEQAAEELVAEVDK